MIIDDCKIVNDNYKNQKRSEKEEENWIKQLPSVINTTTVTDYLLVGLLGGKLTSLPPRRSLDYALMKIRNYDKTKDNYYNAGKLYFKKYKTSNKYGLQVLSVPDEVNKIIKNSLK